MNLLVFLKIDPDYSAATIVSTLSDVLSRNIESITDDVIIIMKINILKNYKYFYFPYQVVTPRYMQFPEV